MVIFCGLVPNLAKVPNFQKGMVMLYGNFMVMMKKPESLDFETWVYGREDEEPLSNEVQCVERCGM
jgi:hypothetical protein